jgi:hypothetical protein
MNNNIIEGLNKAFNEFSQNYIAFCSSFAYKKKDINNDPLLVNELIMLEISINDLVIQLQNINVKIDALQSRNIDNEEPFYYGGLNTEQHIKPLDNDTNKVINKTMKEMMPLFLCALMNNDKNSILNSNTFMQSAINTMEKLSNTMPPSYQISHQQSKSQVATPLEYDRAHNVDDVD